MPFPLAAAAILGGGQILGGIVGSQLAGKGAQQAQRFTAEGLRGATAAQAEARGEARGAVEPFRAAGRAVIGGLGEQAALQGLDPTTQLNLESDTRALNRRLAAAGKTRSGEGIEQFSQLLQQNILSDQALKEGRFRGLRDLGLIQASTTAGAALRKGSNIANLLSTQAGIQGNAAQINAANQASLLGGFIGAGATFGAASLLGSE